MGKRTQEIKENDTNMMPKRANTLQNSKVVREVNAHPHTDSHIKYTAIDSINSEKVQHGVRSNEGLLVNQVMEFRLSANVPLNYAAIS